MSRGYRQPPLIKDERGLRNEMATINRRQRQVEEEDLIVEAPRRLLLRSPNGHYWAIAITDAGALIATDVGPMPL